jgi:hypothetical protein
MVEPVAPVVNPAEQVNNQGGGTGTDPKQNANPTQPNAEAPKGGENAFDERVFDDPRLWTHPRFKSLNERAKKADALEKANAEAEEKRLQDAKKFEELANKRAAERDEIKSKFTSQLQDNRIITEASKVGVVDIETVLKLVDRANITIDENGNVSGAVEAVQALLAAKPFLKGKPGATTIGSPTNPGADANADIKKFKLSQLQNPIFYRENEKDILAAYKAGLIEDDVTK